MAADAPSAPDRSPRFWNEAANELHWFKPWDTTLEWNAPDAQWFVGGKTNICFNCVDRHVADHGDKTAITWVGDEPQQYRHITYKELQDGGGVENYELR